MARPTRGQGRFSAAAAMPPVVEHVSGNLPDTMTASVAVSIAVIGYAIGHVHRRLGMERRHWLAFRIGGFGSGLLSLVVTPLLFLVAVLLVRIWCEMIIAIFRIAENTGRLAEAQKAKAP